MSRVIETLREEHRNLARLLDALDHQIEVFAEAVRPDYDVIPIDATIRRKMRSLRC